MKLAIAMAIMVPMYGTGYATERLDQVTSAVRAYQKCVLASMMQSALNKRPLSRHDGCRTELEQYGAALKRSGLSSRDIAKRTELMRSQTERVAVSLLFSTALFGEEFLRDQKK